MKYVLLITFVFALGCAEQHSTPPPPPSPVTVVTVPPAQPAQQPPASQTSSKEEPKAEQQTDVTPTMPQEKEPVTTAPPTPPATEVNPQVPIVPPPPPPKSENPESQVEKQNNPSGVSDPFAEPPTGTNKTSSENPPKETTTPDDKKTISGTPASDAAEKAAYQATKDNGVQPPGSRLIYFPEDEPRIQYYKAFISGNLKAEDVKGKLLADPSFNRSVWVIEDLRTTDKRNGTIGLDEDAKFQELGQTLGQAAVTYNRQQDSLRTRQTVGAVLAGTVLGAIVGRLYIKNEWIQAVQTKFGPRIPLSFKASRYVAGGVAAGTTVWVGMETIHLIRYWAGYEEVYSADPLLDAATH